ncbi:MAG: hypothetical protein TEF_07540 [Rhizobiales bacterium NRL2]|jgi:two-component system cell cycle sensor histidine kinase PleC|nr:MAG: hypothetical protein TEF_07540 [Rhizobiales bacterium NRL2]
MKGSPGRSYLLDADRNPIIRFQRQLVERHGVLRSAVLTTAGFTIASVVVSLICYEILGIDYLGHPIAIVMPIVLPVVTGFPTTFIIHLLVGVTLEREKLAQAQQQELAELAWEAAEQRSAAEAASRSKSAMLANMTHELRTPLNAIIGFSDVLKAEGVDGLDGERLRQYALDINLSGRHLLELVNDLLELARLERGNRDFYPEAIDLGEKIAEVCRIMREQAASAGVALSAEPGGAPVIALTDDQTLRQMLLNLISNALKFTPSGGEVRLFPEMRAGHPCVSVRDTGIGIAEDDRERIFDPFSQVDNDFTRRKTGSGLGLALVKTMIEQQGGRIELESAPGQGSTFRLVFPEAVEQAGSQAAD